MDPVNREIFPNSLNGGFGEGIVRDREAEVVLTASRGGGLSENIEGIEAVELGFRILQEKLPSWASSACWLRYATSCVREFTCSFLWIFFRWVLTV